MQFSFSILTIALLVLGIAGGAVAEDAERSDEQLALELLQVTGGADMARQAMQMMSVQMRPMFPTVPEALWSELLDSFDADELSELVVPIYLKHFSREELAGLLEFYRSPLGQRMIESMPLIMRESMAIGTAWGRQKAMEIIQRLEKEGYKPTEI